MSVTVFEECKILALTFTYSHKPEETKYHETFLVEILGNLSNYQKFLMLKQPKKTSS